MENEKITRTVDSKSCGGLKGLSPSLPAQAIDVFLQDRAQHAPTPCLKIIYTHLLSYTCYLHNPQKTEIPFLHSSKYRSRQKSSGACYGNET